MKLAAVAAKTAEKVAVHRRLKRTAAAADGWGRLADSSDQLMRLVAPARIVPGCHRGRCSMSSCSTAGVQKHRYQ